MRSEGGNGAVEEVGLEAHGVTGGYGERAVVSQIDLALKPQDSIAVIGPNGAGKTTLLRLLGGSLAPAQGYVTLNGIRLDTLDRRSAARAIAIVPQKLDIGFGLTVREVIMLGRTPYLGFLGSISADDTLAVRRAAVETDVVHLLPRPFASLSGGEAQRAILAMALAQDSQFLLLDEPTVHLDLGQQWHLMGSLMRLRAARHVGILAIVHDLSLAGLNFDRIVLLKDGKVQADGRPAEVLTESNVSRAFGSPVRVHQEGGHVSVWMPPSPMGLSPESM